MIPSPPDEGPRDERRERQVATDKVLAVLRGYSSVRERFDDEALTILADACVAAALAAPREGGAREATARTAFVMLQEMDRCSAAIDIPGYHFARGEVAHAIRSLITSPPDAVAPPTDVLGVMQRIREGLLNNQVKLSPEARRVLNEVPYLDEQPIEATVSGLVCCPQCQTLFSTDAARRPAGTGEET